MATPVPPVFEGYVKLTLYAKLVYATLGALA